MTFFEKLLLLFVLLSVFGWLIISKFKAVTFFSASRNVLQHFIFAFSILLTIQSVEDINTFLADSKWFAWGTLIFSVISILNGSFFSTGNYDTFSGFERAGGWTGIPNAYSAFLVLSIIISFYQYKIKELKKHKYILIFLCLFLLTTLTRNGILAVIIFAIFFMYHFSYKNKFKRRSSIYRYIIKYSVVLLILIFILFSNFQNVIEGAVNRDIDFSEGELENTRILFWGAQLNAISQWNFEQVIFGVNYDNILNNLENGLGYRIPEDIVNNISPVENGLLYIFVGSGITGLVILLIMLIYSWKNLGSIDLPKYIIYFIKGVILVLLVQTMFMDFMFLSVKTYYFVFLGLSFKYYKQKNEIIPL